MSAKMFAKQGFFAFCVLIGFGKACIGAEPSDAANDNIRQPSGFFVMQQVDRQNVSDAKLTSPKWTGIVIRQRWSAVEPTANAYDWKFIDGQAARAKRGTSTTRTINYGRVILAALWPARPPAQE